jgi:peroxiredoxin
MKTVKILAIALLVGVLLISCGKSEAPKTKEEAVARIDGLLDKYYGDFDSGEFEAGLAKLDEILSLCEKFSFRKESVIQIIDKKHFTLMKLGRFEDSLREAFRLDEMAKEIGEALNPWYCLKIADSYLGLKDLDKTVEWIGKAVHERNFKNYKIFSDSKYDALRKNDTFLKLIQEMKDRIGLQHPAKDFTIALVGGGKFSLSANKGKVVLIDFWDVQCAPCVKAIPELKKLYEAYHKQGLEIIGISLDTDKDLLKGFLEKKSIPYPVACSYKGYDDETAKLYGINATPSTWLIDRKGILQYNEAKGDELKAAIEALLKK